MKINDWQTHRKKLLQKPAVRQALQENEINYQIARALITARVKRGVTQKSLAQQLKTKQSVISRVENAHTLPSLSFLKRLASALDVPLRIQFG